MIHESFVCKSTELVYYVNRQGAFVFCLFEQTLPVFGRRPPGLLCISYTCGRGVNRWPITAQDVHGSDQSKRRRRDLVGIVIGDKNRPCGRVWLAPSSSDCGVGV